MEEGVDGGEGGAGAGAGGKRGSRVGFDSTPNSPESKDTDDTAIGSPYGDGDGKDSAIDGSSGLDGRAPAAAASSSLSPSGRGVGGVGGGGRDSGFGGTHLAAMKNGVIQEETEDESMGEQALLSTGDEGELKSCR